MTSSKPGVPRGTRGRIVDLLRRSTFSANEIAARLDMTHNAVRSHLAELMRTGLVREAGLRKGASRPSVLYELVPRAESTFSHAYVPFVGHLLRALGERMSTTDLDDLMRNVGRSLAEEMPRLRGDLPQRVTAANALLEQLGALTEVEQFDHGFVIRGYGCLLSEAVHGRPEVCRAVERMLSELLEVPVEECCERGDRPRCCFKVDGRAKAATT
jgi:DeoR family transcriptional regulator, suf operon transcriptional repressor